MTYDLGDLDGNGDVGMEQKETSSGCAWSSISGPFLLFL